MNDQPNMPVSTNSFPGGSGSGLGGGGGSRFVLTGLLTLGLVVFVLLTFTLFSKYTAEVKSVNAQKAAAAIAAAAAQKSTDDIAATKAGESPFRSYSAPDAYGSFVINFPKDWSSYVDSEQSGIQLMLVMNPNFVTHTNGQDDPDAARVSLQEQTSTQWMAQFAGAVQQGQLHQTNTTISGQPAFDLVGSFPDRKTVHEVVVPVRDKVLVFASENNKYKAEFSEILAQAKVNP